MVFVDEPGKADNEKEEVPLRSAESSADANSQGDTNHTTDGDAKT